MRIWTLDLAVTIPANLFDEHNRQNERKVSNINSNLTRNLTRTFPEPNPNTMDYLKLHEHITKRYDIYLFEDEIKEIVDIVLEMHNENPETCTMKTAMQEMFEELHANSYYIPIGLLAKCAELMAKEKDQIIKTYIFANIEPYMKPVEEYAEQYYKETYGDDK